jgi:predicted phosphate transport protein (TIGR00153 family)
MFSSLMPQRKEFFELLAAHSDRVVAGANATLRLLNGLGAGTEDIAVLVAEVNMNEQSADKIKSELITLLHRSFTTPINRDQIHTLTIELDNVLNALQDVANAVGMYNIKESTTEAREMAALAADAAAKLNRAVVAMGDKNRKQETSDLCKEIDAMESQADRVQRKAITGLFAEGSSIWNAIRMREFYALQEEVLDRCEDAAKTIEEILIDNS